MNDSNQIRDAFAHYRYRRASQLLEGDSDAHWAIAYQHADDLIDFCSFEAGWSLQEATITAQREALARVEAELAEALGEIRIYQQKFRYIAEGGSFYLSTAAECVRLTSSFLAIHAQAEQQEAQGVQAGDGYFASPEEYADQRAALATQPAAGKAVAEIISHPKGKQLIFLVNGEVELPVGTKLYKAVPPAALKLPERQPSDQKDDFRRGCAHGFNACLIAVSQLNAVRGADHE